MNKGDESEIRQSFQLTEQLGEELQHYNGPCNCSQLVMRSDNPVTLDKHGQSMGQYGLVGERAGRPMYRHKESQSYLFYQPNIEGWLVNETPGTSYGRIQLQTSKVNAMIFQWNVII